MTRWHLWSLKRKAAVTAAAVTGVAASLLLATAAIGGRPHPAHPHTAHSRTPPAGPPRSAASTIPAGPGPAGQVNPAPTQTQTDIDSEMARQQNQASIAQAETITVPSPTTSRAYPAIPTAERGDPTAYAEAFVTELLDTDYATQTRTALLAWAAYEAAPDTLPGVPAAAGNKSLIGSLAYAGLPGAQPTPVPAAADWPSPTSGTGQMVSRLTATVDPRWSAQIAQGWQPADPLLAVIDLTGTLTVTTTGHPPAAHLFTVSVMLGTGLHHPGHAAVAIGDWTETP